MADTYLDLAADERMPLALLSDQSWKQRLVERMELGWADRVTIESRYQLVLSPEVVVEATGDLIGPDRPAYVRTLLPLFTRPKTPFVDLRFAADKCPHPHLVPRGPTAQIQTAFVAEQRYHSPANRDALQIGLSDELLLAICTAIPRFADSYLALEQYQEQPVQAIAQYLSEGLGWKVDSDFVRRPLEVAQEAGALLSIALNEEPDPLSASENVLLALPFLEKRPTSPVELFQIVKAYRRALQAISDVQDQALLSLVAEYGRRWEVLLDTTVPINEPFTLGVRQDFPLRLSKKFRNPAALTQRLNPGQASSYHLQVRANDQSIRLGEKYELREVVHPSLGPGRLIGVPLIDGDMLQDETLVVYTADPQIPYTVDLVLPLIPARDVAIPLSVTKWLTASAIVTALLVDGGRDLLSGLAIILIPITFVAAFVLTREQSSLASLLQSRARTWLAVAVALLWAMASARTMIILGADFVPDVASRVWEASTERVDSLLNPPHNQGGRVHGEADNPEA